MSALLGDGDLAWMADLQQQAMPGTVVIERYTNTSDGAGGAYQNWQAVGTVIGRMYPRPRLGMGESAAGAQIMSVTDWWATLPTGTDVTAKDRLVYGGRSFEAIRVNNSEMWQTAVRVECRAMNEERRT